MQKLSTRSEPQPPQDPAHVEALARIERRLTRLERLLHEGIGAYLNAKFPHGKPADRWRRR